MSDQEQAAVPDMAPESDENPAKRSRWRHARRVALAVFLILAVCTAGIVWYASTAQFQNKVRRYVIAALEQSTGGRVELKEFHWRVFQLEVDARDLTIHGLESAQEVPYAHIDRLLVRAKILSFFSPKIGLNLLEAQNPVFHLIVYPDGSTNQPTPKQERNGRPLKDSLFDLAVDRADISNGTVLLNDRAIPFDVQGKKLGLTVTYQAGAKHADRYLIDFAVQDLKLHRGGYPLVQSKIEAKIELQRNAAKLTSFQLKSGGSQLAIVGALDDFDHPRWNFVSAGSMDVMELDALANVGGLTGGLADLDLRGFGSGNGKFEITGKMALHKAGYTDEDVTLSGVNARMLIHGDPDELHLGEVRADLRQGGSVTGDFRYQNWLEPSIEEQKKQHLLEKNWEPKKIHIGIVRARLNNVALTTILQAVAAPRYRDLGYETLASGPVNVDWTGRHRDLTVDGKFHLASPGYAIVGEAPAEGDVDASYVNKSGKVLIHSVDAHSPASSIHVTGDLGVFPVEQSSDANVDLTTTDLSEFDKTLSALGLNEGVKRGSQVLPVQLKGQAEFHGTVKQSLIDPAVRGHLIASSFLTELPQGWQNTTGAAAQNATASATITQGGRVRTFQWDYLEATGEYSSSLIDIQDSIIRRGNAVIHASGQLQAHRLNAQTSTYDKTSQIKADLRLEKANISDLLSLTGQTAPVSGIVNVSVHAGGQLNNLSGGGHLSVQGGEAYGEPYKSLASDIVFSGQEIGLSHLTFLQNGGQIKGEGGYNFGAKSFRIQASGSGFELAHFRHMQQSGLHMGGQLNFQMNGQGTLQDPTLTLQANLVGLVVGSEAMGAAHLEAHAQQQKVLYRLSSDLKAAHIEGNGQTLLQGDYPSQANLNFSKLDIDPILKLAGVDSLSGHSAIAGTVSLSGPAKYPRKINGDARISDFQASVQGVPLRSEGPLHLNLLDGVLHLDPLHITGDSTDLYAQGNLGLVDRRDLKMQMHGSLNLKLAKTLDPDLMASGTIDFNLNAGGNLEHPDLRGSVQVKNAAMSRADLPNGLSQMNGNLQFNQDRLEVRSLTAVTGGGQISVGGYLSYQSGLYSDLTAKGKNIRIRYPQGVSSMADASLRLQGTKSNLMLSGTVLITRFAMNQDLDLASFSSPGNAISALPDQNAPSNRVRLDVHITSAPQLSLQNATFKLAGDVDLRVRGTVATPSVIGRITVTEGSAVFAGTQYQLQHGEIFFTNPVRIDPTIDLNATARVRDYDITIGLHGTSSKLNISYRSEPPLPQADVIALLALGGRDSQSSYQRQQVQSNNTSNAGSQALLSGALNATVSSRVQKLFGVGSVKIDPTYVGSTGTSTPRVTVEQQVAKNVTLTYATNVNSTAQQLIQAEFDLTRTVSLVAVRDEVGVFSVVVKVHRRYR